VTLPEHAFASWMPGISVGASHLGFETGVSDYDLVYATVGESTRFGYFAVGMYQGVGTRRLWITTEGQEAGGYMAAWVSPDLRIGAAGLDRIVFMADMATGMNWFAASGVAIGLYFTPAIAIRTGPVFFGEREYYEGLGIGWWVWSVQLDVDVDLRRPRGATKEADRSPNGGATVPATVPPVGAAGGTEQEPRDETRSSP
jgi:hypothetical protein